MTTASVLDLVEPARRRARLAAVLGRLLAQEPGPHLTDLVAGTPALAPLADRDEGLATTYERLFLRQVPLYESVFTSDDGQRGGGAADGVVAFCERHDLGDAPDWRVAGPDHLGIELWAYGALCGEEAAGWEDDRPDRAARAVEAERELLSAHLGRWAEVAAAAVARRADGTPYAALAEAVGAFVAGEAEQLRAAPDHPDMAPVEVESAPPHVGPARLARWLLAPARCGTYLDADDLAGAARALGIPWRPSDPRNRFREVVEAAADAGDLPALLGELRPRLEEARDAHARHEVERDGNRRAWRAWRLRAEGTLKLLDRVGSRGSAPPSGGDESGRVVVTVRGPGHRERAAVGAAVVERLRSLGVVVAVHADLRPRLARDTQALLTAGAAEVLLTGEGVSAVAWRDDGEASEREQAHLVGAALVVRLEADPGTTRVDVEPSGDAGLRDRALAALDGMATGPVIDRAREEG